MVALLIIVSTSGVAVVARDSVPGDLTYPFKQWVRQQMVYLAPPQVREDLLLRQTQAILAEAEEAAQTSRDEQKIIEATAELYFLGYVGPNRFIAGRLMFEDSYLPSRDALERELMKNENPELLVPGALVRIWYQIVPDAPDQDGESASAINGTESTDGQLLAKAIRVLGPPPTPHTDTHPYAHDRCWERWINGGWGRCSHADPHPDSHSHGICPACLSDCGAHGLGRLPSSERGHVERVGRAHPHHRGGSAHAQLPGLHPNQYRHHPIRARAPRATHRHGDAHLYAPAPPTLTPTATPTATPTLIATATHFAHAGAHTDAHHNDAHRSTHSSANGDADTHRNAHSSAHRSRPPRRPRFRPPPPQLRSKRQPLSPRRRRPA